VGRDRAVAVAIGRPQTLRTGQRVLTAGGKRAVPRVPTVGVGFELTVREQVRANAGGRVETELVDVDAAAERNEHVALTADRQERHADRAVSAPATGRRQLHRREHGAVEAITA